MCSRWMVAGLYEEDESMQDGLEVVAKKPCWLVIVTGQDDDSTHGLFALRFGIRPPAERRGDGMRTEGWDRKRNSLYGYTERRLSKGG